MQCLSDLVRRNVQKSHAIITAVFVTRNLLKTQLLGIQNNNNIF